MFNLGKMTHLPRNSHLHLLGGNRKNYSISERIIAFFGLKEKSTSLRNSIALFCNCKEQSENHNWFSRGMVNDDFRSKHTLLVLHVWMVHKRLLTEGKPGRTIQECLFDELWLDTTKRIRALGVNELSVNTRLSEVQGYSLKCCLELDHAVESKSEEDVIEEIAGTLWRFAYMRRNEVEVDHVLEFARYIRHEQLSLQLLPAKAIFEGRIKWGNLPTWAEAAAKHKARKDPVAATTGDPGSPGEWKEAIAPDGRIYYWNTKTRETQWDKPDTKK